MTTRRGSTPMRGAQRRYHRPNDRVRGRRTTRTAQQQHEGPKDDTAGANTDAKGPTTTQTAQRQHEGPNDDTAGVNANAMGRTTVPQAKRQHGRPNAELGSPGRGFGAEQSSASFFLYVVFYLVHVPRHQGGTTPSLENKYIFVLVTFLQFLRYILNKMR